MSDDSTWDPEWPRRFMGQRLGRLRRAVALSIVGVVGWVSFTLLYVAFWAHGFSLFQTAVVVLVSLLVLFGALATTWVSFGLRWAHDFLD